MQLNDLRLYLVATHKLWREHEYRTGTVLLIKTTKKGRIIYSLDLRVTTSPDLQSIFYSTWEKQNPMSLKELKDYIQEGFLLPLPNSYLNKLIEGTNTERIRR